jgi:hypothetical protein
MDGGMRCVFIKLMFQRVMNYWAVTVVSASSKPSASARR